MSARCGAGTTTGFICIRTASIPACRDWPCRRRTRFIRRAQVVDYLDRYAARFEIEPVFGAEVCRIGRDSGVRRTVIAQDKFTVSITAPVVVVATGIADSPHRPTWPGLETYSGAIVHSIDYRNPPPFAGQRVLVVGFGNSGGEIALDLANA